MLNLFYSKLIFLLLLLLLLLLLFNFVFTEKFKVCVVDGKGSFKKASRYCPILDHPDSTVNCVIGVDRLDCLRKISKGKADFSVFTPEDLVTAINSDIQILLTNELRYSENEFEYQVVAIVSNSSGITSRHDVKDKNFCHPGYGYDTEWSKILSNYFEASIVPSICNTKLTITENRIKASSEFFKSACKAGPWVFNDNLDQKLKQKYPNLCQLCDNPLKCSNQDKYWGRRGSLYCLTDGSGEISWARLDDVQIHFGLLPGNNNNKETSPDGYNFLCPDDTIRPLTHPHPCIWVVKPWPVIGTKRTKAQDIQKFISTLSFKDNYSWQSALINLIETYHLSIEEMDSVKPIETYLIKATGFLKSNSFSGCHPPRTIKICTTSIIENVKCSWLRESAAVYGIEPDLECIIASNTTDCLEAVKDNIADIVMVPSDLLKIAMKDFKLKPLFYETVNDNNKYLTIAVTLKTSSINNFKDLKGTKACFPTFDGIAWNSVIRILYQENLLKCTDSIEDFFNIQYNTNKSENNKYCDFYKNELKAINCLIHGNGDVAFISKNSLHNFLYDLNENKKNFDIKDFKILCPKSFKNDCHLSWSPPGQAMVRFNSSDLWTNDTLNVFLQLDNLFGRNYKSINTPLQIFGTFNGKSNILFHDNTLRFRDVPTARNLDSMSRPYINIIRDDFVCSKSSSIHLFHLLYYIIFLCFL